MTLSEVINPLTFGTEGKTQHIHLGNVDFGFSHFPINYSNSLFDWTYLYQKELYKQGYVGPVMHVSLRVSESKSQWK